MRGEKKKFELYYMSRKFCKRKGEARRRKPISLATIYFQYRHRSENKVNRKLLKVGKQISVTDRSQIKYI